MSMTEREKEVLTYITKLKQVNGYSPTITEIMQGINTNSRNFVDLCLCHLERERYITMKPKSPRTIVVKKFIS